MDFIKENIMRTAEEILQKMIAEMPFELNYRMNPYIIEAMTIYAKQVAEQTLKDASENATQKIELVSGIEDWFIDKQSILNTKIELP